MNPLFLNVLLIYIIIVNIIIIIIIKCMQFFSLASSPNHFIICLFCLCELNNINRHLPVPECNIISRAGMFTNPPNNPFTSDSMSYVFIESWVGKLQAQAKSFF